MQLGIIFSQKLGNGVSPKKFSELRKPDKITQTLIGVNTSEEYWWMCGSNFEGGLQVFEDCEYAFHWLKKSQILGWRQIAFTLLLCSTIQRTGQGFPRGAPAPGHQSIIQSNCMKIGPREGSHVHNFTM